ncbi:hypothetical protein GCM10009775_10270 [Microbacterium aoyamense]|uniref:D-inositol 3-phosphate glycosyltransferase n=1 Tax=Microbacterium aoyamense TaxID=344166 RepID=A0ABN2PFU9_9MICO|nr:glycosyltransferase family 4 protein [Microbacterium aoyamense]
MTRAVVHAITPGDHFSPRTGSAIPTVVHGQAMASTLDPAGARYAHRVLLERGTFHPRYESADIIEYDGASWPGTAARARDAVLARVGVPRRAALQTFRPLAEALRDQPESFVLAHNAPALPQLLRDQPHPSVLYAHNDLLRTFGPREVTRALDPVSAIVCVSADLAERTADQLPAHLSSRVHVVDNGVDTEQFTPSVAARTDGRMRVMFAGRLVPDKGADVLLDAVRMLGRDDIDVVIVGSRGFDREAALSPYERSLRELAAGSRASVTFEPFAARPLLPALLQTADVFVAPARWAEPSGLTIGEAMATGLPVIASRVGGIPEVLGDAGILVGADDPRSLADALSHLADDTGARARYGVAARARAEERDWRHSWRQLRAVLEGV